MPFSFFLESIPENSNFLILYTKILYICTTIPVSLFKETKSLKTRHLVVTLLTFSQIVCGAIFVFGKIKEDLG